MDAELLARALHDEGGPGQVPEVRSSLPWERMHPDTRREAMFHAARVISRHDELYAEVYGTKPERGRRVLTDDERKLPAVERVRSFIERHSFTRRDAPDLPLMDVTPALADALVRAAFGDVPPGPWSPSERIEWKLGARFDVGEETRAWLDTLPDDVVDAPAGVLVVALEEAQGRPLTAELTQAVVVRVRHGVRQLADAGRLLPAGDVERRERVTARPDERRKPWGVILADGMVHLTMSPPHAVSGATLCGFGYSRAELADVEIPTEPGRCADCERAAAETGR